MEKFKTGAELAGTYPAFSFTKQKTKTLLIRNKKTQWGLGLMADYKTYHAAALATGLGAGAMVSALAPLTPLEAIATTALSGYVGALLPEIDDLQSNSYRVIQRLSRIAALTVPTIQFFYRPTDLIIAFFLAWFLVTQFWKLFDQLVERGGQTHSVLAAVCLSLGVAWIAYLTAGDAAAVPAFIASGVGYLLHLLLDDLDGVKLPSNGNAENTTNQPLRFMGNKQSTELYSLVMIGLLSCFALWLI